LTITRKRFIVEVSGQGFYVDHDHLWKPIYTTDITKAKQWKTWAGAKSRGEQCVPNYYKTGERPAYRIYTLKETITTTSSSDDWNEVPSLVELEAKWEAEKKFKRESGEIKKITLGDLLVLPNAVPDDRFDGGRQR